MNKPYTLSIGDQGGLFHEESFATFDELRDAAREAGKKWPDKAQGHSNAECCDYECDGLTSDERDALAEI